MFYAEIVFILFSAFEVFVKMFGSHALDSQGMVSDESFCKSKWAI